MTPKNASQIGSWTFRMKDLEGKEIVVPPSGHFNNVTALLTAVLEYIRTFDSISNGEYSKKQQAFAQEQGYSFPDFMMSAILHQMCVNNKGAIPCWNDGVGDRIHEAAGKIDGFIQALPEGISKRMKKVVQAITPSHVPRFSNCATCGGTPVFDPNQDNSGRAGKVNRMFK